MPISERKSEANKRWDNKNMAYQTVKVRKEALQEFRYTCKDRGEKVNTVIRQFMEMYTSPCTLVRGEGSWADNVKALSGGKCSFCGKIPDGKYENRLEAHHIFPYSKYPELGDNLYNGIALCRNCHALAHIKIDDDTEPITIFLNKVCNQRVILVLSKAEQAELQIAATNAGQSVDEYIEQAISERMERENNQT